jgi:hypothetical protein
MPSYEKLLQTLEGFIMKKFLVVTLVGTVLTMDIDCPGEGRAISGM